MNKLLEKAGVKRFIIYANTLEDMQMECVALARIQASNLRRSGYLCRLKRDKVDREARAEALYLYAAFLEAAQIEPKP